MNERYDFDRLRSAKKNKNLPANIGRKNILMSTGFEVWRIDRCIGAIDHIANGRLIIFGIEPSFQCSSFFPCSDQSKLFDITDAGVNVEQSVVRIIFL